MDEVTFGVIRVGPISGWTAVLMPSDETDGAWEVWDCGDLVAEAPSLPAAVSRGLYHCHHMAAFYMGSRARKRSRMSSPQSPADALKMIRALLQDQLRMHRANRDPIDVTGRIEAALVECELGIELCAKEKTP